MPPGIARSIAADVVDVHRVALDVVDLDGAEARLAQHLLRALLAPHGSQPWSALGQRDGYAVEDGEA